MSHEIARTSSDLDSTKLDSTTPHFDAYAFGGPNFRRLVDYAKVHKLWITREVDKEDRMMLVVQSYMHQGMKLEYMSHRQSNTLKGEEAAAEHVLLYFEGDTDLRDKATALYERLTGETNRNAVDYLKDNEDEGREREGRIKEVSGQHAEDGEEEDGAAILVEDAGNLKSDKNVGKEELNGETSINESKPVDVSNLSSESEFDILDGDAPAKMTSRRKRANDWVDEAGEDRERKKRMKGRKTSEKDEQMRVHKGTGDEQGS